MTAEGPALLVVDDNDDNRYTLTRRLRRQGYDNLTEAADGREALDRIAGQPFDLVLLDVMMPEMNGYEVLERLKADVATRDIPVIMISALDDLDSVVRCIELGAEDYLPKPFNPTLLKARVGASLEKKKLRDQEAGYVAEIEAQRQRSDELLSAILPDGAVRELKESDSVTPRRYDDVAVLFCDVVAFTRYCDRNPPERVVDGLQALVLALEEVAEAHGLEKIKTIGDAFFATAGLLAPVERPVLACVLAARDMVAAAATVEPRWQVRVGVHTGPVVAGVVGSRKFLFDLWGDTVNVAARIAEWAPADSVVMSADAWAQVSDTCAGEPLGPVDLKGKGAVELVRYAGDQ